MGKPGEKEDCPNNLTIHYINSMVGFILALVLSYNCHIINTSLDCTINNTQETEVIQFVEVVRMEIPTIIDNPHIDTIRVRFPSGSVFTLKTEMMATCMAITETYPAAQQCFWMLSKKGKMS